MCAVNLEIYIDNRSFEIYKFLKGFSKGEKLLESVRSISGFERAYFNFETNIENLREIDDYIISINDNEFTYVDVDIIGDSTIGYIVMIFNDVSNGIVNKYKLNVPISKEISEEDVRKSFNSLFKQDRITDCRDRMRSVILSEIKKVLDNSDGSEFLELVGEKDFAEKIYEWKNNDNDDDSYQSVIIKKHKK